MRDEVPMQIGLFLNKISFSLINLLGSIYCTTGFLYKVFAQSVFLFKKWEFNIN